jgi:nickel/cobalt transporter (NicO) family protein
VTPLLAQALKLGWLESRFAQLLDAGPVGPVGGLALVLVSLGIGAAHALAPGHGKALMAAYLVGERGRARDAVAFGAVVAILHSATVIAIALAVAGLGRTAATRGEVPPLLAVGPWLLLASGAIVTGVGVALLLRHLRRGRTDHHHDLPDDVAPLSRRGIVLLGASGGLVPSPSALLVLTTGLFTGRAAFALVLVVAFSLGLAGTLTALGVAVVRGRERAAARLGGRLAGVLRRLPLASAVVVTAAGLVLLLRGALDLV